MDSFEKFSRDRRYTERGDIMAAYYDTVCKLHESEGVVEILRLSERQALSRLETLTTERDTAHREFNAILAAQGELNTKHKLEVRLLRDEINEKSRRLDSVAKLAHEWQLNQRSDAATCVQLLNQVGSYLASSGKEYPATAVERHDSFDAQIERDARAGKLDPLRHEALDEIARREAEDRCTICGAKWNEWHDSSKHKGDRDLIKGSE